MSTVKWKRNADKTHTAKIDGVTFTIKKVVSAEMGGAEVFAVKGSNGYESWGALLRIAKQLAEGTAPLSMTLGLKIT